MSTLQTLTLFKRQNDDDNDDDNDNDDHPTPPNKKPTRNQLSFLPFFLPSFRNTSTKLHSNKAITGSIKQAPKLSYKGSVSEEASEARRSRAREITTKTKHSCRKGSIHSMNWSGVGKTTTTTSVTIDARCEQIRNTLLEFGIHFIATIMI